MAEDFKLDSHKLIYHPCEVARWLNGENIYPIEIEISPSGACNHRCIFCAVDYLGYKPSFLDKEMLLKNISHMHENGLKSVICSGEGEPLLNKDMPDIALGIKKIGVDVAMASNGVLLTKDITESCLQAFTWIRFSMAAIHEDTYKSIHRGKEGDLKRALDNIAYAVEWKKKNNLSTTLGVQCLLIQDNRDQVVEMTKELKNIGVDYFTIKPYSQHTQSENHLEVDYKDLLVLESELKAYEDSNYKVYYRSNAMLKMKEKKLYDTCYGLPFMTHIDAKGNVWPCINFVGKKEYCYGNLYNESFEQIWNGEQRKRVTEIFEKCDINTICRDACRLDEINKYLYQLKNPGAHVNFI